MTDEAHGHEGQQQEGAQPETEQHGTTEQLGEQPGGEQPGEPEQQPGDGGDAAEAGGDQPTEDTQDLPVMDTATDDDQPEHLPSRAEREAAQREEAKRAAEGSD